MTNRWWSYWWSWWGVVQDRRWVGWNVCRSVVGKCWTYWRGVRAQWWRLRQNWRWLGSNNLGGLLQRMGWLRILNRLGTTRRGKVNSGVGSNHLRFRYGWGIRSCWVGLC